MAKSRQKLRMQDKFFTEFSGIIVSYEKLC